MNVVAVDRSMPSCADRIRRCVGQVVSRKNAIDAEYAQACSGLEKWSRECNSELDEIDRRIREREEAIDVEEVAVKDKTEMSDKDRALQEALLQIDKKFGKGSVMTLGDNAARLDIEAISTGSVSLDIAAFPLSVSSQLWKSCTS